VWLIAALLRLSYLGLMVPVISDTPFDAAAISKHNPLLRPFEIEPRMLEAKNNDACLRAEDLLWVKAIWPRTAELLQTCPSLKVALRAADVCTVTGRPASALLTAWGALEELFAPSRAELRFRVSAHIAAYLETDRPQAAGIVQDHRGPLQHSFEGRPLGSRDRDRGHASQLRYSSERARSNGRQRQSPYAGRFRKASVLRRSVVKHHAAFGNKTTFDGISGARASAIASACASCRPAAGTVRVAPAVPRG
jgi:hypothetical protein